MIAVIQIKNGDLMKSDAQMICHQVNCQGVMGSGVARQIRSKWPLVYKEYRIACETNEAERLETKDLLGYCQFVGVKNDAGNLAVVANMFAQDRYGGGQKHTDDAAFAECLRRIANAARATGIRTIAMPYMIGCCRGGGDWNTIYNLIETALRDFDVTLFKYEE